VELERYSPTMRRAAPFAGGMRAIPLGVRSPDLWIVGSSHYGARSPRAGPPLRFAHHINPARRRIDARLPCGVSPIARADRARQSFVGAICARTRRRQATSPRARAGILQFGEGSATCRCPASPSPRHRWSDEDRALVHASGDSVRSAPRRRFADRCSSCARPEADELMIVTHVHDHEARKRSYTLLRRRATHSRP
jgi:hypothetical protein